MIRNEKGFTLIELLVVVLIIGILIAIAIPVFSGAAENARTRSCQANLRTIDGAIAQYESEYNENLPRIGTTDAVLDLVEEKMLKRRPTEPHTGETDYSIELTGTPIAQRAQASNNHQDY